MPVPVPVGGPVPVPVPMTVAGRDSRRGEVVEFDVVVGLGTIHAEDGQVFPFHCTQIAGGSRDVAVGTSVEFDVVPGHLGRWEAARIHPC